MFAWMETEVADLKFYFMAHIVKLMCTLYMSLL